MCNWLFNSSGGGRLAVMLPEHLFVLFGFFKKLHQKFSLLVHPEGS